MEPLPQARIDAIDILRGLALVLMLLLNTPGSLSPAITKTKTLNTIRQQAWVQMCPTEGESQGL